jgi:hypothetical protein
VEVHAEEAEVAVEFARSEFARVKDVVRWTLRADYETAEMLPQRTESHNPAMHRRYQAMSGRR